VSLFAVTWANETSELRQSTELERRAGQHPGGRPGHHVCRDYYGCCRYINYPYYFRQCCYYNGCCPSCSAATTAAPVTPAPTTPAPTPAPTIPDPDQCQDEKGCCDVVDQPLLYMACIRLNGCAPQCGGLGYIIKPSCSQARECCDYPFLSDDFNKCCTFYGCCPTCRKPVIDRKCRTLSRCSDEGGSCKRRCSADEEAVKVRKGCKGRRCKCCVPKSVVITPDCVNATECCSYEAGTGDFYDCCAKYDCCPTCAVSGCPFGNETYSDGEIVRSYPDKCFDLRCSLTTLPSAPYYISQITEYQHSNSCSCCTLAGKMYENGYLLTDDDYCVAVQCVDGEWVNQGYINSNCRLCQIQSPLLAFSTFDNTAYTYGEESCRYSMVQTPKDPSTSYVHVDFESGNNGFYNEYLYFQDTGAAEVSCPGSDPVNNCDYGAVTATPQEITSVGTLGFSWTLGTLDYSIIMGVNKITTMYHDDSLLIWAPQSMHEELEGLCGEYNGDSSDDLIMSTGQTTTDSTIFAESWHSTQSGSNCSLLGSNAGTRHLEMLASVKDKHTRQDKRDHNTDNSMAVGNCASFESDEVLEAYHAACKAAMAKNNTEAINRWVLNERSEEPDDEHMDMCMQVSCLCPDDQSMCLDTFMSMNKVVVEAEARTIDPQQMHTLLDTATCKQPVTGTFKPEMTTPDMSQTIGF